MKRVLTLMLACLLLLPVTAALAEAGSVTYSGNAGSFVFAPGGQESLTDLFPNFKDVMPGDVLTQKITVKNDADNQVKVKLYIRSLGAHQESVDFLSSLGMTVRLSQENEMPYMFDSAASQTAQLTDWVYLGTLYSGGQVDLDVTLYVPAALGNEFQNAVGYLDWEFRAEEFPVEPGDPEAPPTGDDTQLELWSLLLLLALLLMVLLLLWYQRRRKQEEQ